MIQRYTIVDSKGDEHYVKVDNDGTGWSTGGVSRTFNAEESRWILESLKGLRDTGDYDKGYTNRNASRNQYIHLGLNNGRSLLTLASGQDGTHLAIYMDTQIECHINALIALYEQFVN